MRRGPVVAALVATVLAAIVAAGCAGNGAVPAAPAVPTHAAPRVPGAPDVVLYGDSLAWETSDAFVASAARVNLTAEVTSFGGLALCDELAGLRHDLATRRPLVVLLEFAGNSFTPCMRDRHGHQLVAGSAAYGARWRSDLRAAADAAARAGVPLVWATAPLPRASTGAAAVRQLSAIARSVASSRPGMLVVDAGASVLDHGRFTRTLPCRPGEGPALGCSRGRIAVRSPDGTHLCPADPHATRGVVGACPVYSSGARRFGAALVDAARRAL